MKRKWFWILAVALFIYTLKNMFVGADVDEAYGVTLGYRLVQGDRLIWDMWEPHQTSAIFTALFIKLILFITGGSLQYMTVLLRLCFFIVQAGIAFLVCRCLRDCIQGLGKDECILFGMVYYITTPKCIYVPEYSNLHVWFSTLLALFLMQYFCKASKYHGKMGCLILAGGALACDVLSYPSMVLLYPVCALVIWLRAQNRGKRSLAVGVFTLPCVLGAGLFLVNLFRYMNLEDICTVLPCILNEGSHQTGLSDKIKVLLEGLGMIILTTGGCVVIAAAIVGIKRKLHQIKGKDNPDFTTELFVVWFGVQTIHQIICWVNADYNSGYPQIVYIMVAVFGIILWTKSEKKAKVGVYLIGISMLNYFCISLLSNWGPDWLTVYLVIGLIGGLLCCRIYFYEKRGVAGLNIIKSLCVLFLLSEVFGRCLLIIGGYKDNNMIFDIRGISREGVRGGILTSYMNAYRYNNNYELFPEIVEPGSMVIYLGPSQFFYMLGDCRIASPTTISTPEYDESLRLYYKLHPERFPDVVIMESTYGDTSFFAEDDFIYTWIEEDFRPTEIIDYPYVRVYQRQN